MQGQAERVGNIEKHAFGFQTDLILNRDIVPKKSISAESRIILHTSSSRSDGSPEEIVAMRKIVFQESGRIESFLVTSQRADPLGPEFDRSHFSTSF